MLFKCLDLVSCLLHHFHLGSQLIKLFIPKQDPLCHCLVLLFDFPAGMTPSTCKFEDSKGVSRHLVRMKAAMVVYKAQVTELIVNGSPSSSNSLQPDMLLCADNNYLCVALRRSYSASMAMARSFSLAASRASLASS